MQVLRQFVQNPLRNYQYIIAPEKGNEVLVVDPFDAALVTEWCRQEGKKVSAILNTHLHFDHVRGNQDLIDEYACPVIFGADSYSSFSRTKDFGDQRWMKDVQLLILEAPGHTMDHKVFLLSDETSKHAFVGDTIFYFGVGNCRLGGDVETLYNTLQKLKKDIPEDFNLWVGHDYTVSNIRFWQSLVFGKNSISSELNFSSFNEFVRERFPDLVRDEGDSEEIRLALVEDFSWSSDFGEQKKYNPFLWDMTLENFTTLRGLRDNW